MSFCKGMAGAILEVFFESIGFLIIGKTNNDNNFPWFELGGMWRFSSVMFFKTGVQIGCDSDISFSGFYHTFKQIDIFHT